MMAQRPAVQPAVGVLAQIEAEQPELLADNILAVEVFSAMSTQWHTGPRGLIGLRYEALPVVLRMLRIDTADEQHIFDDLRILEGEVLSG